MNVAPPVLRAFATRCFEAVGVESVHAGQIADSLLLADLRGIASHGVTRIPIYTERLLRGVVNPRPRVSVLRDAGALALVSGDNGPGAVVSCFANSLAIRRAEEYGVAVVSVRDSNHNGICAAYSMQAARAGLIGIAATNAPKSMAVAGGREPLLGTNPISFAIPRAGGEPLVLDMATSVVARGKIVEKAKRGESIPADWALDSGGRPTTDARAAETGVMLPFSGAKGSGLAIMIEILCGVLSGGRFGPQLNNLYTDFINPQGIGHFFLIIDPSTLCDVDLFAGRVDALAGMIKASLRAAGVEEILLPGEPEARLEARSNALGVVLPDNVVSDLDETAARLRVPTLHNLQAEVNSSAVADDPWTAT